MRPAYRGAKWAARGTGRVTARGWKRAVRVVYTPPIPPEPPLPPGPDTGRRIYLTEQEAQDLLAYSNGIEDIVRNATNRPPDA